MAANRKFWDEEQEPISYLSEMIAHPASVYGGLSALAAGAILSIPLGLGLGALPLLAWATAETIAALFVPGSPVFQAAIQRKKRAERRVEVRSHLEAEILRRVGEEHGGWDRVRHIGERVRSLKKVVQGSESSLSVRDVERLEDALVDYLGLWLARLVIDERLRSQSDRDIQAQLEDLELHLEEAGALADRRRLEKARQDLLGVQQRRGSLRSRAVALDAALLATVDTIEELHQQLMTNPGSAEATRQLEEAVSRLKVEEELDLAADQELADLLSDKRRSAARQRAG